MKRHIFPILALSAAVFFLTLPTLHYGYLMEDYYYLRSYRLKEIVTTFYSHWEPTMGETKGYRPLHAVHYAFFHWLIGGDPVGNHLLALGLHLVGVYLFYAFVVRCTGEAGAAFWTALIYSCLGTTAWQVSWLVHRQHLLLVIFLFASLILYDRHLLSRSRSSWAGGLLFFLLALLLKESATTFPLIIAAFAFIVRQKTMRSQIKPLLPFFILLAVFIACRYAVLKPLPDTFIHPPPPDTPGQIISDYSNGLLASLLQSHGVRDPDNRDFPVYARGVRDTRSAIALVSVIGLFVCALPLLFCRGRAARKRLFFFGLALLLIANIMVAAWYRTNRLFITSLGVAIMVGILLVAVFGSFSRASEKGKIITGVLALVFFCVYLAANLHTYLEIQRALRPEGYLATTWDRWLIEEGYLPWIQEEQLQILETKLRRLGKLGLTESLPHPADSLPKKPPEASHY